MLKNPAKAIKFYSDTHEALAKVLKLKCSRNPEGFWDYFACFLCFQYVTKRRLTPKAFEAAATELDFCKGLIIYTIDTFFSILFEIAISAPPTIPPSG
jgi:hypothetical protein